MTKNLKLNSLLSLSLHQALSSSESASWRRGKWHSLLKPEAKLSLAGLWSQQFHVCHPHQVNGICGFPPLISHEVNKLPTWWLPLLKLNSEFVQGVLEIFKYFYRLNSFQDSRGRKE